MTLVDLPSPPKSFAFINIFTIDASTLLHRNHHSAFEPSKFNPCEGEISRFAPLVDARTGLCIPTLYAASTREAAAFETLFHDIDPSALFKTVRIAKALCRSASIVRPKRNLRLASLFAPDLKAWGLERRQLIDTPRSTYRYTASWALALHDADASIDGLVWTSRQCDPDLCFVLFGDRIGESDLETVDRRTVADDPRLLLELRDYGRRAGIVLTN